MSIYADQSWVYRFHDTIRLTYQQQGSIIQNKVDPGMVHRDVSAAIDYHERLGNAIANIGVAPFAPTAPLNLRQSRRACTLLSVTAPVLVSDEHTLRSMVNVQNGYTRSIVMACGRAADKFMITALLGTSQTAAVTAGTGVITLGALALPSARKIGDSNAVTLARIINAYELLSKASVPNGMGERIMLYGPGQLRDIMAITQASSSDFTRNRLHDRGTIDQMDWEGFTWLEVPDVVQEDAVTVDVRMLPLASTTRSCIAFHRGAVGLSIGKDITTVIDVRPDLESRPIQVRASMMQNAVRVFEGGVVQMDCKEN